MDLIAKINSIISIDDINESLETWLNWWGRTTQIYLSPNNEVRWSPSWEFPTGSIMTEEEVDEAKRRGYIIIPWS